MTATAALEPHSRHKLRCDTEGQLSDSWAEIECQVDSSRSTRKGHFAGRHDLPLYGVELERRKDDCGEDLQYVLSRLATKQS